MQYQWEEFSGVQSENEGNIETGRERIVKSDQVDLDPVNLNEELKGIAIEVPVSKIDLMEVC